MGEFVAASGRKVRIRKDGSVEFGLMNGYLPKESVFDAEEYFRARRDEELGRWRYPYDPDFVVREIDRDSFDRRRVEVLNERTFEKTVFNPVVATGESAKHRAARAFFEAHPAPKPWHGAQAGEFWTVTHAGEDETCRVDDVAGTLRFVGVSGWGTSVSMPITHHSITTAVRMVAEAAA
ncbi:MAG: hypothetical protein JSS52_11400 [Proteobacteria bacterium]|nr:hypothetical protein [Pseudomonadota bacterium]